MKTIAEVSRELNITTQAIYKKINRTLKEGLEGHVHIRNNQKLIDDEGLQLIKHSLQLVANQDNSHISTLCEPSQESVIINLPPLQTSVANQTNEIFIKPQENRLHQVANTNELLQTDFTLVANQESKLQATIKESKKIKVANSLQPKIKLQTGYGNTINKLLQGNKSLEENRDFYKVRLEHCEKQITLLQEELNTERSRGQAERLTDIAEQLAELSRNNQILLGAEQSRTNPALLMGDVQPKQAEEQSPKEKGFFKKLFKRD